MSPAATVTLRPETPEDLPFLRELYLSTRDDEPGFRDLPPAERTRLLGEQFDFQHRQYRANWPQAFFTIVTVADKPAGRLYVAHTPSEIHLIDLSLLPDYRAHGIGTTLLKNIQAEATRTQVPLRLYVVAANTARSFYDRLGFRPLAAKELHLHLEWRPPPPPGA